MPDISVIDGGIESQGGTTRGRQMVIEHLYDPKTGQLLESWARKAVQLLPRIYKGGGGVKIITVKEETNDDDEVTGTKSYWYACDVEGNVIENEG